MDVKTKSVGGFYSEEAARIVSEAARAPQPGAKPSDPAPLVPQVRLDEPSRPLLVPDEPLNQNLRVERQRPPRRFGTIRLIAWVVLAPWYITMLVGSVGIDLLFARGLIGL